MLAPGKVYGEILSGGKTPTVSIRRSPRHRVYIWSILRVFLEYIIKILKVLQILILYS